MKDIIKDWMKILYPQVDFQKLTEQEKEIMDSMEQDLEDIKSRINRYEEAAVSIAQGMNSGSLNSIDFDFIVKKVLNEWLKSKDNKVNETPNGDER